MSMTKQQMVGAVCGGVFVLCAGTLGWFLYDKISEHSRTEEELEAQYAEFMKYNQAKVFPSQKSINSVKSNETSYVEWQKSARALASRGDCASVSDEEPSVFKQRLQTEVGRLRELPGGVDGHLCAKEFQFGFEKYLGAELPQKADVPRLAVQLDAISHVVDMFAASGVYEVKTILRKEPKTEEDEAPAKGRKNKKAAPSSDEPKLSCLEYTFEFMARPAAFVSVFNALATDTRFMVVKNLRFNQSSDTIVERLAAAKDKDGKKVSGEQGTSSSSSRRRRRRMEAEEEKTQTPEAEQKVDRLVSDPETDAPALVSFDLAVYDFGSGTKPVAEEEGSEKKEGK